MTHFLVGLKEAFKRRGSLSVFTPPCFITSLLDGGRLILFAKAQQALQKRDRIRCRGWATTASAHRVAEGPICLVFPRKYAIPFSTELIFSGVDMSLIGAELFPALAPDEWQSNLSVDHKLEAIANPNGPRHPTPGTLVETL